jgi:hypothetical protein
MVDDRFDSDAREDGAVFAPTRVRKGRGPRALASIVILAIGTVVAIGAIDRQPQPGPSVVARATETPAGTPGNRTARSSTPQPRAARITPGYPPRVIDSVLRLDVRPAGSHLFVHGDIYSVSVTHVDVTLEDLAGHVAATKAVDVPGGSTAFRIGAVSRFDVHFFLPDEVQADGFVVLVSALDSKGHELATMRDRTPRSPESM